MNKVIKEFRDEVYGKEDALFDRAGNNVSRQVENAFLKAQKDQKMDSCIETYEALKKQSAEIEKEWEARMKRIKKEQREDILKEAEKKGLDITGFSFYKRGRKEQREDIDLLIAKEIVIAQKEGAKTSRLTSLSVKLKDL